MLGYPLDTVIQLAIPEGSQSSLAPPFTSEHPFLLLYKDYHALLSSIQKLPDLSCGRL